MKKHALILVIAALAVVGLSIHPAGARLGVLVAGDCIKCHDDLTEKLASRGGSHGSEIGCLDCHLEHPPVGKNVIPECARCHNPETKKHYAVSGCLGCHDPHAPLEIAFDTGAELKTVCVSCHAVQGEENRNFPSKHAEQDCTLCHLKHGEYLRCMECHEPHSEEMVYSDCVGCHKPHMPKVIRYPDETPVAFCAGCHPEQAELLKGMTFKHGKFTCAYCHKIQHRQIPECTACHWHPHAKKIHRRFPDCNECHRSAHDLTR